MGPGESIEPGAANILVVEDEVGMRTTLFAILEDAGYKVTGLEKGAEALEMIRSYPFNVVITDIRLPDVDGMEILELAKEIEPDVAVIMMTGYASLETAVEAVNEGAYAYFVKPVNMDEMKTTIVNALRQQRLSRENKRLVDNLQQSNKLLFEANKQLKKATEAKSAFLASMSHELRTPLNAVIGFSELMLDGVPGEINDEQRQCLSDILSSGQHLLNLINDVLDLSKVEAGKVELRLENLNLVDIINNTIQTVTPILDDKRHKLKVSIEAGLPQIHADKNKLRQIFLNLLSNAIRFTPAGGKLGIEVSRQGDWCQVSVVDNGIGIMKEDQERIFEAFTQVENPPDKKRRGTGLGLALTKQFVEIIGGRIWVESKYGKGSKFTFTLPLARESKEDSKSG